MEGKKFCFSFVSLLLLILFPILLRGEVINVITTQDHIAGSLRYAINTANTNGEDDTIYLPAGTFTLTGTAGEDANAGGDLDIDTSHVITIIGSGYGSTMINGNTNYRLLHIIRGTASISGVTFQNGKAPDGVSGSVDGQNGGGISNNGTLTLTNCRLINCYAGDGYHGVRPDTCGSGGNGGGVYNSNTLTVVDSIITGCFAGQSGGDFIDATGGTGGHGGGIYNNGSFTMQNSTVSASGSGRGLDDGGDGSIDNRGGNGGGIYNNSVMTLSNSTLDGNYTGYAGLGTYSGGNSRSGDGGGLFNAANATIEYCTIQNNYTGTVTGSPNQSDHAEGRGGGIYNESATLNITGTTISGNHTGDGGDGGGIYLPSGYLVLKKCLVFNNYTGSGMEDYYVGNGGFGGGIYCDDHIDIINSTISSNYTGKGGDNSSGDAGSGGYGGGIFCDGASVIVLTNSTICLNHTGDKGTSTGGDNGTGGYGGGLYTVVGITTVKNSIIANNYVFSGGHGDDVFGSIISQGYNLVEDTGSMSITGVSTGNITGQDPVLEVLADNGGPTQTHALLTGSPAIDAGNSAGINEDQRELPRPVDVTGVTDISDGSDIGAFEYQEITFPTIALSRNKLFFGANTAGSATSSQTFSISNSGDGTLSWTVTENESWLSCSPTSGTNSATVTVSVNAAGLSAGTYTGTVSVSDSNATNSPQTVSVTLTVYSAGGSQPPFGLVEAPVEGAIISGSIAVTGWVVDDIEVQGVRIYRQQGSSLFPVGDGVLVEDARPDIEALYPQYPMSNKAGWGYMMLSNMLPNQGNGAFTFVIVATDAEGNETILNTINVTGDNANAVKPFGAIDTPEQGETISGGNYVNFGWALTPPPNTIPTDGSTIIVWVDGQPLGNPDYGDYRVDIATLFPQCNNSDGAIGYYYLDTTAYDNGIHTIAWSVEDDAQNKDGVGSRYFHIQNSGARQQAMGARRGDPAWSPNLAGRMNEIPIDFSGSLEIEKGYKSHIEPEFKYPDEDGITEIRIKPMERVKINLGAAASFSGYTSANGKLRGLPVGSTLDSEQGVFYWQPGPAFRGTYNMVFISHSESGDTLRKVVKIIIK